MNVLAEIAQPLIAFFNKDGKAVPWRKAADGLPRNIITEKVYGGFNALLLQEAGHRHRLSSKWWADWKQWQALGGAVMERPADVPVGHWGTRVYDKGTTFTLFNLDQVEGGFEGYRYTTASPDYLKAEAVIAEAKVVIEHRAGKEALYLYPPEDKIVSPLREQFLQGPAGLAGYYDAIFHELAHWSEARLGWAASAASCELRAEMVAGFLGTEIGLPELTQLAHQAKWMPFWRQFVNPAWLFSVSEAAMQAAHFILGGLR